MNKFVLLLNLLCCTYFLQAQHSGFEGHVSDDLNGYPLVNAAVTVVRSTDSLLINYTRTDSKGHFLFNRLDTGRYDVYISYPDYLGYATEVEVRKGLVQQLDSVILIKNSQLLQEVTIVDGSKIKFKGDTIQFIADSFKVGANASVEDLLKKLSGLQVNAKGEITAFGERVEKVFVDGEEFFGNDPTIATRNIQAKAVDKVQVFDKTSEMEELTGISDGEKFKAINLTLKDEYKKGYFGKAKIGAGLDPFYYDESLMLQAYSGKSKFSLYGIASNTGTTGLDFGDMNRYMGNQGNMTVDEDGGGVSIYYSGDDDINWNGRYNGEGRPQSIAGGGAYSTKLNKDKIRINANYGYSDVRLKKNSTQKTTNFLPENAYIGTERESMNNKVLTNSGKIMLEADLDSLTTVKLRSSVSKKETTSNRSILSAQTGLDSMAITDVDRNLRNDGNKLSLNNELSLIRKFKKKNRSLVFNGILNKGEDNSEILLQSRNQYYIESREELLDQQQSRSADNTFLSAKASYTEPLSKLWTAQVNYYFQKVRNLSNRVTRAYDENTQSYTRVIDSLSNDFDYRVNTNGGGIAFAFKEEKYNFRFGTNVDYADISRFNKVDQTGVYDNQLRWLPSAQFNYKFNRTSGVRFNYNGYTRQPSVDQIQPVRDNSDPLLQVRGNPDLVQSYTQSFNLSYNTWKAITDMSVWSYAGFNNTFNNIVSNTYVDESRRSISTYANVNGGFNGWMGINYGRRINKNFSGRLGMGGDLNRNISFVNGIKTAVLNYSLSPEISLDVEQEEKFDMSASYRPSFNTSRGGLVAGAGNYFSQNIRFYGRWKVSKMIELTTELDYNIQAAQNAFSERFDQAIWNANVQWTIDKMKNFVLEFAVNDILNQNRGYQRRITSNNTIERRYDTIQRYGYLSLIYNIKSKV